MPSQCEELEAGEAPAGRRPLARCGGLEQFHRVVETGGDHFKAGRRGVEVEVQFGGDPTDVPFDVPNGFAAAARAAKDDNVVGIDLGVITEDEAQEGGLARAVGAEQRPAFSGANRPVDVAENYGVAVAHRCVAEPGDLFEGWAWRAPAGCLHGDSHADYAWRRKELLHLWQGQDVGAWPGGQHAAVSHTEQGRDRSEER